MIARPVQKWPGAGHKIFFQFDAAGDWRLEHQRVGHSQDPAHDKQDRRNRSAERRGS